MNPLRVLPMLVCGFQFWLHPANPGLVLGSGCLYVRSACTPPILAAVSGVGVCAWVRVSVAPRNSRLRCWAVCVCVRAATGTPPVLAGVHGACVSFRVLTFTLQIPAGLLGRVCLRAHSACTPPFLALVCGVGVCAWVRVLAAPRHSWLGVLGCVCLCARPCCTLPILARLLGRVWLCERSACTPPFLARVCGLAVCACVWVSATPRHCWPGVAVCVLVCALRLYPASPGWGAWRGCPGSGFGCYPANPGGGVGVCVFVCGFACTPPILNRVCGLGVFACIRVTAAPRHSWLGCWGVRSCLVRFACTPPVLARVCVCGLGVASHLLPRPGSLRVVRASRICGTWWGLLLSTCPCALVVDGGVSLWRTSWPLRGAAPRPVEWLSVLWSAFPSPWCLPLPGAFAPRFTGRLRGAHAGLPKTRLMVPAAGPCRGRRAGLQCSRGTMEAYPKSVQSTLKQLSNCLPLHEVLTYRCCQEVELQQVLAHIELFPRSPVTPSPTTHTQAVTLPCTLSPARRPSPLTGNGRSQLCHEPTACTVASSQRASKRSRSRCNQGLQLPPEGQPVLHRTCSHAQEEKRLTLMQRAPLR